MRDNYFTLNHYEMLSMSSMLAVARAWMMRVHAVIDQQIDYLENYCVNPRGRQTPSMVDPMLMLPSDFVSWTSTPAPNITDDPIRAVKLRSIDVHGILAITEADFSC